MKQETLITRPNRLSYLAFKHQLLTASIALAFLVCVFLWKVVFLGQSFVPADILYAYPPWSSLVTGNPQVHNPLLGDQLDAMFPAINYAASQIRNGSFPLWNPYVAGGVPFGTMISDLVLFPLNAIAYIFPVDQALGFIAMGRLFLMGLFTYLFLRQVGLRWFGALTGAIVYTYSGFNVVWLGWPHTFVSPFIPLVFLVTDKCITTGRVRYYLALSISTALLLLGGFPQVSGYGLFAAGAYLVFRTGWDAARTGDFRQALRRVIGFSLGSVGGMLLVAPFILPFLDNMRETGYLGWRISQDVGAVHLGPRDLVTLLIPDYYGSILTGDYWRPGDFNYVESTGYMGILPLFLTGAALGLRRRDPVRWFFAGLLAFGFAIIYGFPPLLAVVSRLPVFNSSLNTRFFVIVAFATAVLAGTGADGLARIGEFRPNTKTLLAITAGISLCAVGLVVLTQPYQLVLGRDTHAAQCVFLFGLWLVLSLSVLFLQIAGRLPGRFFGALAVAIIICDLFSFGMNFNTTVDPSAVFPKTESTRLLQSDPEQFRVMKIGWTFLGNSPSVYGISDIGGHDIYHSARYTQYLRLIDPDVDDREHGTYLIFGDKAKVNSKLVDMLNVKYIVDQTGSTVMSNTQPGKFKQLAANDVALYQNATYLPRAYVVNQSMVIKDGQATLDEMQKDSFDPRRTVIIEKEPPHNADAATPSIASTADIREYSPNRISVDTDMASSGFLVLSEMYYPGWQVAVDGKEAEIYRADYIFRAVWLEPGKHTVVFVFAPQSFTYGLYISAATVLTMAALALYWAWRGRQARGCDTR